MKSRLASRRAVAIAGCGLIVSAAIGLAAADDAPPPSPAAQAAKQAIQVRKAIFTLIGSSFRPLGEVLQGKAAYDAGEAQKQAARLAFLAPLLTEPTRNRSRSAPRRWSSPIRFRRKSCATSSRWRRARRRC